MDMEGEKTRYSIRSAALFKGKAELRFFLEFLQGFFSTVPRSCQPHTPDLPSAWLGAAERWGINLTSENAPARVTGKLLPGQK